MLTPVGVWIILSSSVADHPLRPATHCRLGEPLPHQLANGTQAHPYAIAPKSNLWQLYQVIQSLYTVLVQLSLGYPIRKGRLPTRYSPVRQYTRSAEAKLSPWLACVRHAASVRPEPGSNSPLSLFLLVLSMKPALRSHSPHCQRSNYLKSSPRRPHFSYINTTWIIKWTKP